MNTTDLLSQFERSFLRAASGNPSAMEPGTVYHYTGAAGVTGILEHHYLRATNFSFLNDPSEVQYGRDLVHTILQEQQTARAGNRRLLQAIESSFAEQTVSEIYVCCFTACYDDLSQWRAYGTATGARYCIGFDTEGIYDLLKPMPEEALFARVIYDKREQREKVNNVVNKAIEFIAKENPSPRQTQRIAEAAARRLARLLPQLKSPAYEAEQEWRVIRWVPTDDVSEVCFDAARGIVRPYVAFPLEQEKQLPVVELLILAPGREGPSVKAADMLLRKVGIKGVQSVHSKVPFAE